MFRVDGDVLCGVFHQGDTPGEPGLDVAGGDVAHLMQVVIEVVTNRVALQVVVVEGKQRESGDDDKGGCKQDLVAEAQIFVHGLKGPLRS